MPDLAPLVVVAAGCGGTDSSRSMMALHQRQALGMAPSDIGQIFLVQAATTILFLLLGGALAVLTGPAALVVAGFALMAVSHVVAAFSSGAAGIWAAALIAGDDVAVSRFLDGTLDFNGIPRLMEAAVERFGGVGDPRPDVDGLVALDAEVRAAFASGPIGRPA